MSAWHLASIKPQQSSSRHENCTVGLEEPSAHRLVSVQRTRSAGSRVFSIPGLSCFGLCRSNWPLVSTGWGFLGQVLLTTRSLGGRDLFAPSGRGQQHEQLDGGDTRHGKASCFALLGSLQLGSEYWGTSYCPKERAEWFQVPAGTADTLEQPWLKMLVPMSIK